MQFRRQNVLFILLGVLIGLTVFVASSGRNRRAQQGTFEKKEIITAVPEIVNCVSHIRVLTAEITTDRPDGYVTIMVENTSDVGIIAISIESKKGKEGYSVIENTFGTDEPLVIIEPHSIHKLRMEVSNIRPGLPIQIGAVVFADGTEEGCTSSLESMHETKSRHEIEKAEKKAKEPR